MEPEIPTLHHIPQLATVADPMVHNELGEEEPKSTDLHNKDDSSSANCSCRSRNSLQKMLAAVAAEESDKAVRFLLS
jgi:hypothetical protein